MQEENLIQFGFEERRLLVAGIRECLVADFSFHRTVPLSALNQHQNAQDHRQNAVKLKLIPHVWKERTYILAKPNMANIQEIKRVKQCQIRFLEYNAIWSILAWFWEDIYGKGYDERSLCIFLFSLVVGVDVEDFGDAEGHDHEITLVMFTRM